MICIFPKLNWKPLKTIIFSLTTLFFFCFLGQIGIDNIKESPTSYLSVKVAWAQNSAPTPTPAAPSTGEWNIKNPLGGKTLQEATGLIVNTLFGLAAIVALIYLIIGGYSYITSSGNPEAMEMAKASISNAILGLIIILLSYLIISFVLDKLNVTGVSL